MHNKAYTPGSSMCCHNAYTIQAAEKLCYYKKKQKNTIETYAHKDSRL